MSVLHPQNLFAHHKNTKTTRVRDRQDPGQQALHEYLTNQHPLRTGTAHLFRVGLPRVARQIKAIQGRRFAHRSGRLERHGRAAQGRNKDRSGKLHGDQKDYKICGGRLYGSVNTQQGSLLREDEDRRKETFFLAVTNSGELT